jgi:hypothetical protein
MAGHTVHIIFCYPSFIQETPLMSSFFTEFSNSIPDSQQARIVSSSLVLIQLTHSISGSTQCNSLSTISAKFKTSRNYFVHVKPNEIWAMQKADDETLAISAAIHELLDCRESCNDMQNTTKTDVDFFLTGLSIHCDLFPL